MYFSEEYISEVQSKNPILDIVAEKVKLKKSGKSYKGCCPFHAEKTPSFNVTPSKDMYYCFGCNEGGNVFTFIQKMENLTFSESVKYLAERAGMDLPKESASEYKSNQNNIDIENIYRSCGNIYYRNLMYENENLLSHYNFHGITANTLKKYKCGYAPVDAALFEELVAQGYNSSLLQKSGLFSKIEGNNTDIFHNKLIFPVFNTLDKITGYIAEPLDVINQQKKWCNNNSSYQQGKHWFGLPIAKKSNKGNLIIADTCKEVLALSELGFDNVITSTDATITDIQADALKRYTNTLYLLSSSENLDNNINTLLNKNYNVKILDTNDSIFNIPVEHRESFITESYNSACDYYLYKTQQYANYYDLFTENPDTTTFVSSVNTLLSNISDTILRDNYSRTIESTYNVNLCCKQETADLNSLFKLIKDSTIENSEIDHSEISM